MALKFEKNLPKMAITLTDAPLYDDLVKINTLLHLLISLLALTDSDKPK